MSQWQGTVKTVIKGKHIKIVSYDLGENLKEFSELIVLLSSIFSYTGSASSFKQNDKNVDLVCFSA